MPSTRRRSLVTGVDADALLGASRATEPDSFRAIVSAGRLAAYCGLVPKPRQSGNTDLPGRISKAGNPRLRRAAYLVAVSGTRTQSGLATFYQRLIAAEKPRKVALIALARKILTVAYAVVTSRTPYNPDYASQAPVR